MLSDFNSKKLVDTFSEVRKAKEDKKNIEDELSKTRMAQIPVKNEIDELEEKKSTALVEQRKTSIFSRIASIFHIGKYYRRSQNILEREKALDEAREKLQTLYEKEGELIGKRDSLSNFIKNKELPEYFNEEYGRVVITDKVNSDDKNIERNGEEVSSEKKVLVHSTNFFPKDHRILSSYDGGKVVTAIPEYHGVRKEVSALSHRHEVHFTINNRVKNTGAGEGNWDNPSYIVIDDFAIHENDMESKSPSDAWNNGKSFDISPNAVILVDINKKAQLPLQDDNIGNYNIVYYDGEATACLQNFLKLNNYDVVKTDANDADHAHSDRMRQEHGTFIRNIAINFMRDNSYNSRDVLELSANEIAQITDIAVSAMKGTKIPDVFSDSQLQDNVEAVKISTEVGKIYMDIANFVVSSGMKKNENGTYTFKSDEEILEDIIAVRSDRSKIPSCVDIDFIDEVFMMERQLAKQYRVAEKPTIEEVSQIPVSEIFKFENQLACEVFQESLPELTAVIGCKDNKVILDMYKKEIVDISDKVRLDDSIRYKKIGYELANYQTDVNIELVKVADVQKLFEDFERNIQEIKDRKETVISVDSQR